MYGASLTKALASAFVYGEIAILHNKFGVKVGRRPVLISINKEKEATKIDILMFQNF